MLDRRRCRKLRRSEPLRHPIPCRERLRASVSSSRAPPSSPARIRTAPGRVESLARRTPPVPILSSRRRSKRSRSMFRARERAEAKRVRRSLRSSRARDRRSAAPARASPDKGRRHQRERPTPRRRCKARLSSLTLPLATDARESKRRSPRRVPNSDGAAGFSGDSPLPNNGRSRRRNQASAAPWPPARPPSRPAKRCCRISTRPLFDKAPQLAYLWRACGSRGLSARAQGRRSA